MSDPNSPMRPNSADVRRAAQELKDAIDAHLLAVETRFGEDDPSIDSAFEHIRHCGHIYDELMIQVHGEGSPFGEDFLTEDDLDPEGAGSGDFPGAPGEMGELLSIYVRRDYLLTDAQTLIARGREAHEMVVAENPDYPEEEPVNEASALYAMYNFAGVDGIDLIGDEAGLAPLGAVVWFMAADEPVGFELDRPFHDLESRADDHLLFKVLERSADEDDVPPEAPVGFLGGDPLGLPPADTYTSGFGTLGLPDPGDLPTGPPRSGPPHS